MNGNGNRLVFEQQDFDDWAAYQRKRLEADVHRASPIAIGLLETAGATGSELLKLAERVIRDPDWRSGFLNPCTIVVRDAEHPAGRLGAWEEQGALCVEAELSAGTVFVVRGGRAELRLRARLPRQKAAELKVRSRCAAGKDASARSGSCAPARSRVRTAETVVRFATRTRPYRLLP